MSSPTTGPAAGEEDAPARRTLLRRPRREASPQSDAPTPPRAAARLGTAARLGIVLALLLWVLAVYWAVTPLEVPTSQGPPFACGSALDHPSDQFGRNVCGRLNDRTALKAGGFGVAGLVVLAGGFLVAPRRGG